jgi:hypothetical protein
MATTADIFEEVKVDEKKVNMAIEQKVPLVMTTYTLPRRVEKYIEKVVAIFLSRIRQENLKDHVVLFLRFVPMRQLPMLNLSAFMNALFGRGNSVLLKKRYPVLIIPRAPVWVSFSWS